MLHRNISKQIAFFCLGGHTKLHLIRNLESATCVTVLSFHPAGGFWNSRLIEKGMIDFFVPFLPLEYRHVMQCLLAQMKVKGLQENRVTAERIARDLVYFPKFERVFSQNGCKAIENRLEPDEWEKNVKLNIINVVLYFLQYYLLFILWQVNMHWHVDSAILI